MPNKPEYIVWHTAAHGAHGVDYDTTAAQIDAWHRDKGWAGIGYNYVIRKNGNVENGRDETKTGAHTIGLNARSIGICFSGHGDIAAHADAQRAAGLKLTRELMARYGIAADHVIGHREVNKLVAAGELGANCRTSKTCPGMLVDMDEVRAALAAAAAPSSSNSAPPTRAK